MPAEYLHVRENEPGDNKQEAAAIVGHQERREGGRERKMGLAAEAIPFPSPQWPYEPSNKDALSEGSQ